MIAKLTYGSSAYGVLTYAESKKESLQDKNTPGAIRLWAQNFSSGTTVFSNRAVLARQLTDWSSKSSRAEKSIFHASIALPPGEDLTNDDISKLAQRYMETMGYGNNPFVVYRHNDTHHSHIHIISSRVGENGKIINPSYEFKLNKTVCRSLEKEFNLSEISSEKGKSAIIEASDKTYSKTQSFKSNVLQNLEAALLQKDIFDLPGLAENLKSKNIEMVYSGPDGARLPNSGLIFYRIGENAERESRLKGWSLGKKFGVKLEEKLQKKKELNIQPTGEKSKSQIDKNTPELSFKSRVDTAKKLANMYNLIASKGVIDEKALLSAAFVSGLTITLKHNAAGFNGFSVVLNGNEFKPSDFSYNGIKLSSTHLKSIFYKDDPADAFQRKLNELSSLLKKAGSYTSSSLHNALNRHGFIVEQERGVLYISSSGIPGRFPFITDFSDSNISERLNLPALNFEQQKLYSSLLLNKQDQLANLSRSGISFSHGDEPELTKGASYYNSCLSIHDRIEAALLYSKSPSKQDVTKLIQELNIQGLAIDFNDKSFSIKDIFNGQTLNPYQLNYPFNNKAWQTNTIPQLESIHQFSDPVRSAYLLHYQKTGEIEPEKLQLLLSSPHFRTRTILLQSQFARGQKPESSVLKGVYPSQPMNKARVSNNTQFDDLWESKRSKNY